MEKYICIRSCFFNNTLWSEGQVLDATNIDKEVPHHFVKDSEAVESEVTNVTDEDSMYDVTDELAEAREEYKKVFGKDAHPKAKAETLKAKIAEKSETEAPANVTDEGDKAESGKQTDEGNAWDNLEETALDGVEAKDVITSLLLDSQLDDETKQKINDVTDEAEQRKIITWLKSQ